MKKKRICLFVTEKCDKIFISCPRILIDIEDVQMEGGVLDHIIIIFSGKVTKINIIQEYIVSLYYQNK